MKITDKKVLDLLKRANTGDEEATNQLLEALVCVLLDIREGVSKGASEVYTQPTDNPDDIIVGKQSVYNPLQEGYTPKSNKKKGKILPPKGGTGESLPSASDQIRPITAGWWW